MSTGRIDLTPQLVQAVRDAIDIVAIASDHTKLRRQGKRYGGLCPLHKEKTPSFSVDPDQGLFYCFGCGAGGDAIRLHMLLSGDDFPAAIESLAQRYGIHVSRGASRDRGRQGPDLRPALEAAQQFFQQELKASTKAQGYLRQRKMPPELIEGYALGYAPDSWHALREKLSTRLPIQQLLAAGLVAKSRRTGKLYDRFRDRLIFPIRSGTGRLLGFGGRTLGDDRAKYINSAEPTEVEQAESEAPVADLTQATRSFQKSEILYGLFESKRSIRESGRVILTEGYFDVLGTVAAGLPLAVASMGTSLTREQAQLLSRFAEEVVVAYDGDAAGDKAFRRALPLLLQAGLVVRRAQLPSGEDPDSIRLEQGAEALQRFVEEARDGVDAELERLIPQGAARDPRALAERVEKLVPLLGAIQDPVLRRDYVVPAASRLAIGEDVLLELLQRHERQRERQPPSRRNAGRRGGAARQAPPGGPPEMPEPPEFSGPLGPPGPDGDWSPPSSAFGGGVSRPPSRGPRETRSLEERVLAQLLAPRRDGDPVPRADELSNPEVFFDRRCRLLYTAFLELYESSGRLPDAASLQRHLEAGAVGHETLARIESSRLEEDQEGDPLSPGGNPLAEGLATLERRYITHRLRELAGQMRLAERAGRQQELLDILDEREVLKRRLHRLEARPRRS